MFRGSAIALKFSRHRSVNPDEGWSPFSWISAKSLVGFDLFGARRDGASEERRAGAASAGGDGDEQEQASFNTQVAQDLKRVQQQIDLTQADINEARQAAATSVAPTALIQGGDHQAAAAAFIALGMGVPGYPRLANDGAPLLPQPQEAPLQ